MPRIKRNDFDDKVGENIKRERKLRKLTLEEVSTMLGISRAQYCKYENGKSSLNISRLRSISQVFNKPISYFVK